VPEHTHHLSGEGFERLHVWCLVHAPQALEDPEFLPGLIVVIELEVEEALRRACWKQLRLLNEPCRQ
jgi:hypothetical protein